jgi:lipopolysaccharide export system permease protein
LYFPLADATCAAFIFKGYTSAYTQIMLILSRLIVKEWFKGLVGAVVILFLLITTADLINGFLQGKDASRVLLEYSFKMPDLMGKMLPICCLVASLFSLNKLKAHAELISILAAGYSYLRIYFFIGTSALVVMGVQFMNLGYIEPYANSIKRKEIQKSRASEGKYLTRSSLEGGKFWFKSQQYFASFSFFDRRQRSLNDLELFYFGPDHRSRQIIRSKQAKHLEGQQWQLEDVTELTGLETSDFPVQKSQPQRVVSLNELPEDFEEFEADLTTLSFFKLSQFVSRLSKTGININEYYILLLNKVFLSLVCVIFALMPLSTIFNPNRRSSSFGKNVVFTLLITVIFWVLYSSSVAMGNNGYLPPILATGIIPFCFSFYVLWTFVKNQKLSI